MTEIKVLHIFGAMNRGGAEMRALEVMRLLRPEGFICDVLALSGNPGELDPEVEMLGGHVHLLRRSWGWKVRLRQLIRNGGYDVVHSHVHFYSGAILREAAREGVRVRIVHFHSVGDGMGNAIGRQIYRWWMSRLIDHNATSILGVSQSALAQSWPRSGDSRAEVVYNGLDVARFFLVTDVAELRNKFAVMGAFANKVIVHVGNFTPPKNHQFLVRIFAELAQLRSDVHLVLVGHGSSAEEVQARALVVQFSLEEKVSFLGVRSDVPEILSMADLFLFPSTREGLPGALLEACASGLPCVVSDIPPCREIAERIPGVTCMGLDRPISEWAAQLLRSLESPADRNPAVCQERLRRGGFDLESSAAAFRRIWNSVPTIPDQRS